MASRTPLHRAPERRAPQRSCVGCRRVAAQRELLRVASTDDAALTLDLKQRLPGRGAYLCPDPACLRRAVKGKALERAFRHSISSAALAALEAAVTEHLESTAASGGGQSAVKET